MPSKKYMLEIDYAKIEFLLYNINANTCIGMDNTGNRMHVNRRAF